MKKTMLTMVVTASLAAASQASAMDVNAQNMAPDVSANNYFSENSFEQFGNPQSGYYVAVHAMNGHFTQKSNTYNTGGNQGGNDTFLTADKHNVSGFGVSVGHQDSEITDNLARLLQVKRVSYGLELDSTSGKLNGNIVTNNNPGTYSAQYSSLALMATGKINVLQVWRFSPYFEFGGGVMHQELKNYNIVNDGGNTQPSPTVKNTGMAYLLGVGVDVFVSSHFDASVGYRYITANDLVVSKDLADGTPAYAENPRFSADQGQLVMNIAYDF
ncbi:MAG: hypothetical protein K5Q00_04465 [Gammaproteobacteria bacterium]|nr:hypothetical protein [Gammaproteobacteria bacterium]